MRKIYIVLSRLRRRARVCKWMSALWRGFAFGGNAKKKLLGGMSLNGQVIPAGGITPKSMPKLSQENFGMAYESGSIKVPRACPWGCFPSLCLLIIFLYNWECFAKVSKKDNLVTARSAIVVDLKKGKIVYAKNIHTKRAPASTLKILTALVALEQLGPDAYIEISRNASLAEPTKLWLRPGEKYRSIDLIKAVLISSANDASRALAEAAAGSEIQFAEMMNKKARSLGAKNSNFINASGLPAKEQYSTVYDLYRIVKAALNNPIIRQIMKKKKTTIQGTTGKEITLVNHNKLLFRISYPVILGKTGYTKTARHCYASIAYFEDKEYAIVILKSKKPWTDMENLLKLIKNKK